MPISTDETFCRGLEEWAQLIFASRKHTFADDNGHGGPKTDSDNS